MATKLDGSVYPIQFRLHDNRYPNSPKAQTLGGGAYRSDLLSLGEPAYDPVRHTLSIGVGNPTGLSAASGDTNGDLIAEVTPLSDGNGNKLTARAISNAGVPVIEVSPEQVAIGNSMLMRDLAGVDKALFGHGYGKAAAGTLYNVQKLLTQILAVRTARATGGFDPTLLAIMVSDANSAINKLFDATPQGVDVTKTAHNFPEVFGFYVNLLTNSESFDNAAWAKDANLSVIANSYVSPDGTKNAETLVDSDTALDVALRQDIAIASDAQYRCFSVFLHQGSAQHTALHIRNYNTASPTVFTESYVTLDWSTMTLLSSNSAGVYGILPTKYAGWYRLYVATQNASKTNCRVSIRPASGFGAFGTEVGNTYAWGAQLNYGRVPDLYVSA